MTHSQTEIKAYLQGPRPYDEGVSLYLKYGRNQALKNTVRRMPPSNRPAEILAEELRKLCGMSERELAAMQRTARQTQPAPAMGGEASDAPPPEPARGNKPAGETERKMVKFRDRFPFLNTPQCPDVLKILVADMFTAYNLYKEAHSRLAALPGDPHLDAELEDTAALCRQVVERYLENRTIWEELEHYQEHRALLGKHPRVKAEKQREWIRQLPDLELKQLRDNASANLSKWKDKLKNSRTEQEEEHAIRKLEQHTARKQAAEMELERRKPK